MAKYDMNESYVVYTRPRVDMKSCGLFMSRLFGGISIVIKGIQFKYSNGILIETPHIPSKKCIYFKSRKLDIKKARKYVNKKWSIINNCFTSFVFGIAGGAK